MADATDDTIPGAGGIPTDPIHLAIVVHNRLSALIKPATPASIRVSSIWSNKALMGIWVVGGICFLLLIYSAAVPVPAATAATATFAAWYPNFIRSLGLIGAAGVGSAFSQLYTATEYLRTGTFEPQYNQIYIIRFALGIIAGAILGQFGNDLLQSGGGNFSGIAQTSLALIGGFSAEAVYQILQRVSDTLVTVVRGTGKDQAEATARQDTTRKMTAAASQIFDVLDPSVPAEARDKIHGIVKTMIDPQK